MDLFKQISDIISRLFIYDKTLEMETSLVEDLGADSFDYTKLATFLEEEFEIEISPDEIYEIVNLGDILSLVERKQSNS